MKGVFFNNIFIGIWLIYNIILFSDVQHSDLIIIYFTQTLTTLSIVTPITILRYYIIGYILYIILPLLTNLFYNLKFVCTSLSFSSVLSISQALPYGNQQSVVSIYEFISCLFVLFFVIHI